MDEAAQNEVTQRTRDQRATGRESELIAIGEFADAAGLSISAVRFYANRGVLLPAEVDRQTGYRRYLVAQVPDGRLIRDLRRLEMPLPEITRALQMSALERRAMVDRYLAELTDNVERVHSLAQSLGSKPLPQNQDATMTTPPSIGSVTLDARSVSDAIGQVLPAVGQDPAAPHLMTVLLETKDGSLRLVATDRHRLAIRDLVPSSIESTFSAVVAASSIGAWTLPLAIDREITIVADATTVSLGGGLAAAIDRIPVVYPDYQTVLDTPAGLTTITARPGEVLAALEEDVDAVTLHVSSDGTFVTTETGTVSIDAACTGPEQAVLLNPAYLRDAVAATIGLEVVIDIVEPLSPLVIRSADNGTFTAMVMPIAPE